MLETDDYNLVKHGQQAASSVTNRLTESFHISPHSIKSNLK